MQYKRQVGKLDCGISIVQTLHKYYFDEWIELSRIKNDVNYNNKGINLIEISKMLSKYGIQTKFKKGNFDSLKKINLKNNVLISLIENIDFFHYIIIEKIVNNKVIYYDPLIGKQKMEFEEFKKIYSGIIGICKKINVQFENSIIKQKINLFELDYLKYKISLIIASVIIIMISFILSLYIKLVLDQIAPSNLYKEFIIITLLFLTLTFFKIAITTMSEFINNKLDIKYQTNFIYQYIEKIENVKFGKISHYDESMHLKNLDLITAISNFKSRFLINIITQTVCLIFSTSFLLVLSAKIFFISLLFVSISTFITIMFQKKFKTLDVIRRKQSTITRSSFMNIANGIAQIKLKSLDKVLKNDFINSLDETIKIQTKLTTTTNLFCSIQIAIKSICPFIIIVLAINDVWNQDLSIGEVFLYLSMFNYFFSPISSLTYMIIEIPVMKQFSDEINSFFTIEDEEEDDEIIVDSINEINIKKIKRFFDDKNKIEINNLTLNSHYKLTGKNGSGKTSLLNIISTLQLDNEEILFNGTNVSKINKNNLRNQICFIKSNEFVPSTKTIFEYLVNGDEAKKKMLVENIEKYKLLDLFEITKLSLSNKCSNLSLGQKCFVSIMRLFTSNYSLVLLDEVFENMDAKLKNETIKKLKKHLENKIVIEVSHHNNFIYNGKEINCELLQ